MLAEVVRCGLEKQSHVSQKTDDNEILQRRAKRLNHINSSFLAQEEGTRNAETTPAHPEP